MSFIAKYALALASIIFRQDFQINLRSVLLFCPWLDPVNQIPFYGSFFYELGLVDELGRAQVEAETSKMVQSIKAGNLLDARNVCQCLQVLSRNALYDSISIF